MKRKCSECDFEADDEEYIFVEYDNVVLCGNCNDAIKEKQKG